MKRDLLALLHRVKASGDREKVVIIINRKYREPHRVFYTAAYLRHCLAEFDPVKDMPRDPDALELALVFYRAVYFPFQNDNEVRSADFAEKVLCEIGGLSEQRITRVRTLILAMQHDRPIPLSDLDAIMMADIDLSWLGAHPELFNKHMEDRRTELRMERGKFLEQQASLFVELIGKRQNIFGTKYFRDRHESQARKNIECLAKKFGYMK